MSTHRLLFVCAQNVCRSRYLAGALSARWGELGDDSLLVSSRGAEAVDGSRICAVALGRLAQYGLSDRGEEERRMSRALTERDVARAGLILTAAGSQRAAVARLDPTARSRAFTVREAIALAAPPLSADERTRFADAGRLTALAALLHSRRGTLAPATPAGRGWFARAASGGGLDIPDAHTLSSLKHRRMFDELDRDIDGVVKMLRDRRADG